MNEETNMSEEKLKEDFKCRNAEKRLEKYHKIIEENPKIVFPFDMDSIFEEYFPEADKKNICIPYSGDNLVAYAFYCMGAKVKSIDYIKELVEKINILPLNGFKCECAKFEDTAQSLNNFDLIFTTVATIHHIENLKKTFCLFNTMLKNDGKYIFFEKFNETHKYQICDITSELEESGFIIKNIIEIDEKSISDVIYKRISNFSCGIDRKGWIAMCCIKKI